MIRYRYELSCQQYHFERDGELVKVPDALYAAFPVSRVIEEITTKGSFIEQQYEVVDEAVEGGGVDNTLPIWEQGTLKLTQDQLNNCRSFAMLPGWGELEGIDGLFDLLKRMIHAHDEWMAKHRIINDLIAEVTDGLG